MFRGSRSQLLCKKAFTKNSTNSKRKNLCRSPILSSCGSRACNVIKIESPAQMFSFEVLTKVRNELKQPKTIWNDLKRSRNDRKRPETTESDLKSSKTTKNNQCLKLNWLIKGICLRFSNAGCNLLQGERCWLKNKN